jgi:hypothetical protein
MFLELLDLIEKGPTTFRADESSVVSRPSTERACVDAIM